MLQLLHLSSCSSWNVDTSNATYQLAAVLNIISRDFRNGILFKMPGCSINKISENRYLNIFRSRSLSEKSSQILKKTNKTSHWIIFNNTEIVRWPQCLYITILIVKDRCRMWIRIFENKKYQNETLEFRGMTIMFI